MFSRLLNSVYNVNRVFGSRIIHQCPPIALQRKAFQNFIPKAEALSGFDGIQRFANPFISIPRTHQD